MDRRRSTARAADPSQDTVHASVENPSKLLRTFRRLRRSAMAGPEGTSPSLTAAMAVYYMLVAVVGLAIGRVGRLNVAGPLPGSRWPIAPRRSGR